jgi:hypothetical protein
MTKMQVEITAADIGGAGHGNSDDPLARALNRTTGKEWRTEIYSAGRQLRHGRAWVPGEIFLAIDQDTTKALQAFDTSNDFAERRVYLEEPDEENRSQNA